jgi:alpha-galactosidase
MEVCLVDIDPASLALMTTILKKMVKKAKAQVTVTATTNQREALENANYVYKSISVGIQESEWIDIHVPQKYGIPQNTGDTCGPGGLFRGLRCIQAVSSIARDMKELCPKAVMLNYTNPQASIVMAARRIDPELQFIGLCHELFGGMGAVKSILNKQGKMIARWQDLDIVYGGINHFAWLKSIQYKGEDLYPLLKEHHGDFSRYHERGFNGYLLNKYGYFPYPGDRHVAEFMPEYYNYFNHDSKPFGITRLRDVGLVHMERTGVYFVFHQWAKWAPVLGPTKHGELAMEMTLDCMHDKPTQYVCNIPNKGYIPNLPEDTIVEIPGFFKDGKLLGVDVGVMPEAIADLVRPHAEQQFLTVDAGLGNDPGLVIKAMQHDPMCKFIDDEDRIEDLTWNMLYHEQKWLPPEWQEWIPKKEDLVERKHWVDEKELVGKDNARKNKYPVDLAVQQKVINYEE